MIPLLLVALASPERADLIDLLPDARGVRRERIEDALQAGGGSRAELTDLALELTGRPASPSRRSGVGLTLGLGRGWRDRIDGRGAVHWFFARLDLSGALLLADASPVPYAPPRAERARRHRCAASRPSSAPGGGAASVIDARLARARDKALACGRDPR